jgi:hypothetical protein
MRFILICVQSCNIETRSARLDVAGLNANEYYNMLSLPVPLAADLLPQEICGLQQSYAG